MRYNPKKIREQYNSVADYEDKCEKERSLRVEIPREFIKKYLKKNDVVLDAGGGSGINSIMMSRRCKKVTLLDISPKMLELAEKNIKKSRQQKKIEIVNGDIISLPEFKNGQFSFVVCVGDSISYVLDKRFQAIRELVRVAKKNSILIIGCDSKFGFMRYHLNRKELNKVLEVSKKSEDTDGMGGRTHLYTINEMTSILEKSNCKVLEIASTPSLTDTINEDLYTNKKDWPKLKKLEMELCTQKELLGIGSHLLFVARKK